MYRALLSRAIAVSTAAAMCLAAQTLALKPGEVLRVDFATDPVTTPCPNGTCDALALHLNPVGAADLGLKLTATLHSPLAFLASRSATTATFTFDSGFEFATLRRPFTGYFEITTNQPLTVLGPSIQVRLGRKTATALEAWPLTARVTQAAILPAGIRAEGPKYTITDLGVFSGTLAMQPSQVSNSGWAVGTATRRSGTSTVTNAFLWTGAALLDLGRDTSGYGINDLGQSVGTMGNAAQAVRWSPSGAMTMVGYGAAMGINNSGGMAGAVPYTIPGGEFRLGPYRFMPMRINEAGRIAGYTIPDTNVLPDSYERGMIWDGQLPPALWLSLGPVPGENASRAVALNNFGQAVGISGTKGVFWDGVRHANPPAVDLNAMFGAITANDINDDAHVVGADAHGAYLWDGVRKYSLTNQLVDNFAGWHLSSAVSISESGYILAAGSGLVSNGAPRALLLAPVCVNSTGGYTPGCPPQRSPLASTDTCVPTGQARGGVPCTQTQSSPPSNSPSAASPSCQTSNGPNRGGASCAAPPSGQPSGGAGSGGGGVGAQGTPSPAPTPTAPTPTPACVPGQPNRSCPN